jgi:AraC-like DNA-binding protein
MDAVSHLLRQARLEARLDKHCLLGASTRMDIAAQDVERRAPFHVLLEGNCLLQAGSAVLDLEPGDVVVIPSGTPHRIITPGPEPLRGTVEAGGDAFVTTRSHRGGDGVIDLFCGHYRFGSGAGALLFRSLPDPVKVSFGQSAESADVLHMLSALMRGEAQREGAGTAAFLSAMCTALLAMVLRTARGSATDATLWTAAGDEPVAAAVEQILAEPGADWSIERLSREAAMSRATFLRRFARGTGMTVGAFLTQARLIAAADLLDSSDLTVAAVALRVGYRSESAFTRAFRSAMGVTPARFRRAQQP